MKETHKNTKTKKRKNKDKKSLLFTLLGTVDNDK